MTVMTDEHPSIPADPFGKYSDLYHRIDDAYRIFSRFDFNEYREVFVHQPIT